MDDLIRRSDAEKVLCDACGNAACPKGLIPRCSYYEQMQAIPAVDAVEVRHARWVHVKTHEMNDEYGGLVGEAYCSECELYSSQLSSYGRVGYDYCPRCGARMDGEDGAA